MDTVVIAGADGRLGQAILHETIARRCSALGLIREPRPPGLSFGPQLLQADLLDCSALAALLEHCAALVVPLGYADRGCLDLAADLQISVVLGAVARELAAAGTRLLLAGRHARLLRPPVVGATAQEQQRSLLVADRAALLFYTMQTDLQWTYVSPQTTLGSADVRADPDHLLVHFGEALAPVDDRSIEAYAARIVEHLVPAVALSGRG